MSYFPMFIDLKNARCLVVGGGSVAYRKVCALLEFEAEVTVLAEKVCVALTEYEGRITIRCEKIERLQESQLTDYVLVIAATDDIRLNHEIALLCKKLRIPVNAVDQKEDCSFIFPSYFRRGQLTVGVTTSGSSPSYAATLRKCFEKQVPDMTEALLEQMAQLRVYLRDSEPDATFRGRVLKKATAEAFEKNRVLTELEIRKLIDGERI